MPEPRDDRSPDPKLEAARYALLRRLAPPIRHDMATHLQPIGMLGEVLARRLASPAPELPGVRDSVARLATLARGAVQASLDVVAWLAPDAERRVTVAEGVGEIVDLLRSHLGFRGIVLQTGEIEPRDAQLLRSSLRTALPAALLLLADSAGPPAEIRLSARAAHCGDARAVELALQLEPTEGEAGMEAELPYRALTADEVAALAAAERVSFEQQGDAITLRLQLLA